ncbi:MAG TPA: high-potential iron-sulfur protein [Casimicrobiaceae bacterium]|nr:high-potential iron-sulfur protein [Casimicrobiaceae bacterium]
MKAPLDQTRRRIIVRGAHIVSIVVAATVAGVGTSVAAKASKSELMYQDRRHDGKGCGDCKFFTPAVPGGEVGQCSVVEGQIRRDGWCLAFAANVSP